MNKAIVINQVGIPTFIECESDAQAVLVYESILNTHMAFPPDNVTIIFSDGSIKNSHISSFADPDVYLRIGHLADAGEDVLIELDH